MEEVNFSHCNLFTSEISAIHSFLNILAFKMTPYMAGTLAQGNVIYFYKVYVMGRVQAADKAKYLCLE